ncbi:MAG: hypothetical protein KKE00_06865, partial [Proteobacteria bacterium]|nr:hypothetical protein [Pseudomonadota bacterium]MBU1570221.1 hypothetical protein [Pseudomonadota bacterium]
HVTTLQNMLIIIDNSFKSTSLLLDINDMSIKSDSFEKVSFQNSPYSGNKHIVSVPIFCRRL